MHVHQIPYHEIRDPIYGTVRCTRSEYNIINHRFVQRLRGIRQLGFAHYPFPGAILSFHWCYASRGYGF